MSDSLLFTIGLSAFGASILYLYYTLLRLWNLRLLKSEPLEAFLSLFKKAPDRHSPDVVSSVTLEEAAREVSVKHTAEALFLGRYQGLDRMYLWMFSLRALFCAVAFSLALLHPVLIGGTYTGSRSAFFYALFAASAGLLVSALGDLRSRLTDIYLSRRFQEETRRKA